MFNYEAVVYFEMLEGILVQLVVVAASINWILLQLRIFLYPNFIEVLCLLMQKLDQWLARNA